MASTSVRRIGSLKTQNSKIENTGKRFSPERDGRVLIACLTAQRVFQMGHDKNDGTEPSKTDTAVALARVQKTLADHEVYKERKQQRIRQLNKRPAAVTTKSGEQHNVLSFGAGKKISGSSIWSWWCW